MSCVLCSQNTVHCRVAAPLALGGGSRPPQCPWFSVLYCSWLGLGPFVIHGLGTCFVYVLGPLPSVAQGPESSVALLRGPAPPVPLGPLVQCGSVLLRSCLTSPYLFSARLFLPLSLIAIWLLEGYIGCIAPSRSSTAWTPSPQL